MKHIVSLSGGKDSTAMLLMMLAKGMPVDDIIFADTGAEFPEMYKHLDRLENYIGRKITRIKNPDGDFYYFFSDYEKTRGKNKGTKGYGWPSMMVRWCTRMLKDKVIGQYLKDKYDGIKYYEYIGIAYDERHRAKDKKYPLIDWQITEAEALQYCYDHGFDWGGLYEIFNRVSCYLCPLQRIGELRNLRKYYPELWKKMREIDRLTEYSFRADYSLKELEERFEKEDKQMNFFEDI